jgi:hypothetical protein
MPSPARFTLSQKFSATDTPLRQANTLRGGNFMEWLNVILEIIKNIGPYVAAVNGILVAVIALCLLIPGEQPEKLLQSIVDFLSKLSKK